MIQLDFDAIETQIASLKNDQMLAGDRHVDLDNVYVPQLNDLEDISMHHHDRSLEDGAVKAAEADIVEKLAELYNEIENERAVSGTAGNQSSKGDYKSIKESYLQKIARVEGEFQGKEAVVTDKQSSGIMGVQELEAMFERDDCIFRDFMKNGIEANSMDAAEYVKKCISRSRKLFNIDRGCKDAKKTHLADIKSTKIETPALLNLPLFDSKMSDEDKAKTVLKGNVKAIIPLCREKYHLEVEKIGNELKNKYKRISRDNIFEKRVFGLVICEQVGYIPNVQISFTEDEENFNRDTYLFKPLL